MVAIDTAMAEAAIRSLTGLRTTVDAMPSKGRGILETVELVSDFNYVFVPMGEASEELGVGRDELQAALVAGLLADSGLTLAEVTNALGGPLDGASLDDILTAFRRAVTLSDVRYNINKGDDLGMSEGELNNVHDLLAGLNAKDRAWVLKQLTDQENTRMFHNVHSDGFWSNDWNDRQRTEFYELFQCLTTAEKARLGKFSPYLGELARAETATAGDPAAKAALEKLRTGDGFVKTRFDQRIALLAQSANYPNARSIGRLEQLSQKKWFRKSDLGDSQRSAKMVAYLAAHQTGDRTVIDNTLDLIVGPDSLYEVKWEQIHGPGVTFGRVDGDGFILNEDLLPADDKRVVPSATVNHLLLHTVVHEVNHLVNDDTSPNTYDRFMGEYRAWYVGFVAEFGRPPDRGEILGRVKGQLDPTDGVYDNLDVALNDPKEGEKIANFVQQFWGPNAKVDPKDLVAELTKTPIVDPGGPAPVPVPVDGGSNNLNNDRP